MATKKTKLSTTETQQPGSPEANASLTPTSSYRPLSSQEEHDQENEDLRIQQEVLGIFPDEK